MQELLPSTGKSFTKASFLSLLEMKHSISRTTTQRMKQEMKVKDNQKQVLVSCLTRNSLSSHLHATNSDSNDS